MQKKNKDLQQLLLKHKELERGKTVSTHIETVSTGTQTDEVTHS